MSNFADLEDDLNAQEKPVSPALTLVERVNASLPHSISEVIATNRSQAAIATLFTEVCKKCGGSGIYRGYSTHGRECFACHGKGALQFKTSPEARAKSRASARAKRQQVAVTAAERFAQFKIENPDIAAWWADTDFEFAISLRESCRKYGELTERQLASAKSCVEKLATARAAKAQQRAEAVAKAPVVNIENIETSLKKARSKGIKRPKILLAGEMHKFVFSLAGENSRNPGAVYVKGKTTDAYLGKIQFGRFIKSGECDATAEQEVLSVCADPEQAAIAFGRRFGICSCCGRELTVKESIDRGIGPICFEKYFG